MCVHNMVTTIYWWLYCMRDCVVVSIWLCGFLLSAQRVHQFHIKLFSLWECTKANTVTKDTTLVKCHVRYHIIKIIIKIQCFVSKSYLKYRLMITPQHIAEHLYFLHVLTFKTFPCSLEWDIVRLQGRGRGFAKGDWAGVGGDQQTLWDAISQQALAREALISSRRER